MEEPSISSVEEVMTQVRVTYDAWETTTRPWFRGEPTSSTPLVPKLYRSKGDGPPPYEENRLLQFFRMKAPALSHVPVPPRSEHTDQWLFLAQHVGLPTRLLDWTEGALHALYFALLEAHPVLWMLDPVELNRRSLSGQGPYADNEFPLTWVYPEDRLNIGSENIRGAWEKDQRGVQLPVAVHPTNIHVRMSAQRSCFTVHGKDKRSLREQVPDRVLKRFAIDPAQCCNMRRDLRMMGISHSTIFPDLDGLAKDLKMLEEELAEGGRGHHA